MNRNLGFIAAALLLWGVGEGMFFNFVPIHLESEFLLSKQQVGFALGAFGFFMAITHLPGGHLADRVGRRPLLIIAWTLGLISTLTMGLAKSLPFYLIGLLLYGVTAFVSSPLGSYVTAARGKWEVGTALSLTTATFNMGMALGPVTGGWIAETVTAIAHEGVTILLVEQNAHLALQISRRAYVMETGTITLAGDSPDLARDPQVRAAYLGE